MEKIQSDKKAKVASMFNSIAHSYDFLNHFLSMGIDRSWRRRAIRIISKAYKNPEILDVAAGTGDLSIAAVKLDPKHITGIDISLNMIEVGREKIRRKGLSDRIELLEADSENIPFNNDRFDVAMVAFGVRNFADPAKGLSEMKRVVRAGGMVLVLEFSKPDRFPFKQLYNFYFLNILPLVGRLFSSNETAYSYLPESVMQFPDNEKFMRLMTDAGLSSVRQKKLTWGIASIYTGLKASMQ
ncbi:MAG: bifunctional demethylmenaquinone methyltransferase/2-methoxy-6-polyprenyl-1,4-benzoquinol methylase UbiE [Bacteroidales bacterium]|jgi:demethylmenaquinone methyltransferase/2-methoxy-6-polyprenyl-1,4-benzoquinol methylase|nr:bifunctional demethylmenaquinone methyltransferase/2-methoxy-6-polyprenyl-1,4-benzoquinol methylase UbiE [Bacteroidales bacterium]